MVEVVRRVSPTQYPLCFSFDYLLHQYSDRLSSVY
jgi:hypothetical protein